MEAGSLSTPDAIALAVLALAGVRGLWIGAVREAFSLAALAAACVAVRLGTERASDWLAAHAPVEVSAFAATVVAGVTLGVGTVVAVGLVGRLVRRGVRFAGLGLADRLAGGLLGVAEGALVGGLALWVSLFALGREDPRLADSRAVGLFEIARSWVERTPQLPSVATPPPERR